MHTKVGKDKHTDGESVGYFAVIATHIVVAKAVLWQIGVEMQVIIRIIRRGLELSFAAEVRAGYDVHA